MRFPRLLRWHTDLRADLSEDSDFFLALVDRPLQWRERLVEEFALEAAAHVRVTSSYQIDFPPDLVRAYVDTDRFRTANILLPVTTREKCPLLNLDISGPGGAPARLLSRASIAALEAQYLLRLIVTSPARGHLTRGLPDRLLEAVCVFTPDYFESLLCEAEGDEEIALLRYLRSGLGDRIALSIEHVRSWRERTRQAAAVLAEHGNWFPDGTSSAEEPLLAIPRLDPLPVNACEIDLLLQRFNAAVLAAARTGDDVLLRTLAEYGRRYEFAVEVEVPLLEPFGITVMEDRPAGWRSGNWLMQDVRLGDGRSVHLEARTLDPNVVIEKFRVEDLTGRRVALGPLESVRHTDETLALYSSEPERADFARIWLLLRPRQHLRWTSTALMGLNLLALGVAVAMAHDSVLVERLSLLTVPTTLAATFVLVREQTALASRLQRWRRIGLGVTTALLWVAVLVLLLTFHPS